MFDLAARKGLRILQLPENKKARRILWNDNETLIIMFSEIHEAAVATQRSREYSMNIAYDASGGAGRLLEARRRSSSVSARKDAVISWRSATSMK